MICWLICLVAQSLHHNNKTLHSNNKYSHRAGLFHLVPKCLDMKTSQTLRDKLIWISSIINSNINNTHNINNTNNLSNSNNSKEIQEYSSSNSIQTKCTNQPKICLTKIHTNRIKCIKTWWGKDLIIKCKTNRYLHLVWVGIEEDLMVQLKQCHHLHQEWDNNPRWELWIFNISTAKEIWMIEVEELDQ